MKLREIASLLNCQLHGEGDIEISGVAGLEQAAPGQLTFLANSKYAPKVKETRASAILVQKPLRNSEIASLVSSNPYHDFARALELFYQPPRPSPGIHPLSSIAASATIGPNAFIGAFVSIGHGIEIVGCNLDKAALLKFG